MNYYKKKIKTIEIKVRQNIKLDNANNSRELSKFAREIYKQFDDDQEHLIIIFLDSQNNITGYKKLFSGGQTAASVDPKIIFRNALLFGAVKIAIVHNHSSYEETITPSQSDNLVTQKLLEASKLLDINLVDHIIISQTSKDYYSYADNNKLLRG